VSIRNLNRIFKPGSVAVVGASATPSTVGFTVLHNLLHSGFSGEVFAVNPHHASIQGIRAYPAVSALPRAPDLAVVCTPAATVPTIIEECGKANILGLIIISAGFREIGPKGKALEETVRETASRFDGMRILGPNCLGIIVPGLGLNASFAADTPQGGSIAFLSQSGALCTAVLDWALVEDIGFSHFVSLGNMLDVDFGDLIDYLAEDEQTRSIILYIESITGARKFVSAARAFTRTKPIIVYKAGRFAESAKAAASHTGALAGEDAVYDAAFSRAGIVRVFKSEEMFDCAELLARQRIPRGDRLGIVTNAGGPGVMATDALMSLQGKLASLSEETFRKLDALLPPHWSKGNPIDVLGDAPPERYARAIELTLADKGVDAALVILAPQAITDPTAAAKVVSAIRTRSTKPILCTWMGGRTVGEGVQLLNHAGLPTYGTPEQAVQAFMHMVTYARNREVLYETPLDINVAVTPDRRDHEARFREHVERGQETLSEAVSKELLESYGLPVTKPRFAASAEQAVEVARQLGYPVVMKVQSPHITHKTDVGGVVLNLREDREVMDAFQGVVARARESRPEATVEGVTIQPMITRADGFEMILGSKKDPTFGSAILVGMGGVAAEVFRDRALGLPPLNERLATHMVEALKSWPLLTGHRGRPRVNLEKLVEILIRFSYLVADLPQIKEIDVNPLLVTPRDVMALDARVILDGDAVRKPVKPYSHLVIRPYPEQYVQARTLLDGTRALLRPIRPEDEPLWHELLASCSRASLFQRFQYVFTRTHEMAARFCFIDYDREMAIVAEIEEGGRRKLVGVGRLVSNFDRETAEYAVLVTDAWQGRGLGSLLTDYCLEIAKDWGAKRVVAVTTPDNVRMLEVFKKRDFEMKTNLDDKIVEVTKDLFHESRAGSRTTSE